MLAAANAAAGDVLIDPPAVDDGSQADASPVPDVPLDAEEHSAEYLCKVLGQCPQGGPAEFSKHTAGAAPEHTAGYMCKTFGKQCDEAADIAAADESGASDIAAGAARAAEEATAAAAAATTEAEAASEAATVAALPNGSTDGAAAAAEAAAAAATARALSEAAATAAEHSDGNDGGAALAAAEAAAAAAVTAEAALSNGMGVERDAQEQGLNCVSIRQGTTDTWCSVTCMATMCPDTLCKCGTDQDALDALKAAAEQEFASRTDDSALDTAATSELKAKLDIERKQIEDEQKQLLGDATEARENAEQMVRDAQCPSPMPNAECPMPNAQRPMSNAQC